MKPLKLHYILKFGSNRHIN